MTIEFIDLNNPARNYTFSSAVKAGNFILTAHIGGFIDENGNTIDDIEGQTKQCFETLKARLAAADASLNDVIKINVFLKKICHIAGHCIFAIIIFSFREIVKIPRL